MKRLFPLTGAVISVFIALLGYVLRMYRVEASSSLLTFAGSFVSTFLSWLIIQYIIQLPRPKAYGWKALLSALACILLSLALFYSKQDPEEIRSRFELAGRGMGGLYILLLMRGLVIGGFLFFIAYLLRMAAASQQSKLENERLKQENLRARLSLLQEQISPHFLFNSLGTLRSMIEERAPRQFIQHLSEVYRYLLSNSVADLVELRSELDFAQAYLHILRERFEKGLIVDIDVEEAFYPRKLPPVTLQLLIENAVKHNVMDEATPLKLRIHTEGGWLTVSNSLQRKNIAKDSMGTGLRSIRDRYRLLANLDIVIEERADRFKVSVPLLAADA